MRKELEVIKIIEQYLNNELSAEDKARFETQLEKSPSLQKEVEKQKLVLEGIKNVGVRTSIKKAKKTYSIKKLSWYGLIAVAVGVAIAGAVYLTKSNVTDNNAPINNIKYEVNENGEKQWADADALVPSQFFEVNGAEDKILETQEGIVVAIPEGAFLDENGNPVAGNIEVEIKEAITPEQIILSGLSTQSGDDLLETGGMFYINARKNGKSLTLNPDNPIVMDVPTDEVDGSMELYQGVRQENGGIDWQNPKPMEQFLTPVDIHSLDFYPPNYEQTLIALGEGDHTKEWKDSVYYSFGGEDTSSSFLSSSPEVNSGAERCKWKFDIKSREGGWNVTAYYELTANNEIVVLGGNGETMDLYVMSNHVLNVPFLAKNSVVRSDTEISSASYTALAGSGEVSFTIEATKDEVLEGYLEFMSYNESVAYQEFVSFSSIGSEMNKNYEINPSKVQAIWLDKFQNTLIATKEFEERMGVLHHLSKDAALDLYVNNTDKRLSELDSFVVEQLGGYNEPEERVSTSAVMSVNSLFVLEGGSAMILDSIAAVEAAKESTSAVYENCNIEKIREKFIAFAAQGKGRVKMDKGAAKMLKAYYDNRSKAFAKAATKAKKKLFKEYQDAYGDLNRDKSDNSIKNSKYSNENLAKEFKLNLEETYRQLGIKKPRLTGRSYRVSNPNTGWNNIDKIVREGTEARTTINVEHKGKKAEIQYLPVSFTIENEEDYDRVLVYLLPEELDSYQRVMKSEGGFTEKLNEFFKYKAVVVGFKGQDIYMGREYTVTTGDYSLSLVKSTKQQFKQAITDYGRSKKMKNLMDDITEKLSIMFQQGEINKMEDNFKFRETLAAKIFECYSTGEEESVPVADTTSYISPW